MSATTRLLRIPRPVAAVLSAGIVLSLGIVLYAETGYRRLEQANRQLATAQRLQTSLLATHALVISAEAGQRGYLLTGRKEYLEPYEAAVPRIQRALADLAERLVAGGPVPQHETATRFAALVGKKLAELDATLDLYKAHGPGIANALLETGIGKRTMDAIQREVDDLTSAHRASIEAAEERWQRDVRFSRIGLLLMTASTIALLVIVWVLVHRIDVDHEKRRLALADERSRLRAAVEERTAALSELSNHLQTVREEEKSKLARDMHDELGGILVSAKMDVAWAQNHLRRQDPVIAGKLERALAALDEGVQIKRRIIEELRPTLLDNLGLGAALQWQVEQVCASARLAPTVSVPDDDGAISPTTAIALFRIAQESLTNIAKYAKATAVHVALGLDATWVRLVVEDDGIGIPEDAQYNHLSHGIAGMRQRVAALGGTFAICRRPEGGTRVEVSVPIESPVARRPSPSGVRPRVRDAE